MKTDTQIRKDVISELAWDNSINSNQIGVSVENGVVTLFGYVNNYSEKWSAEIATEKVLGVKAIVIELKVNLPDSSNRNDVDIALAAKNFIEWTNNLPKDLIKVAVEKGIVTLTGEVFFEYQRQLAASSIRYLIGVKGVNNLITLKPLFLSTSRIKAVIDAALNRRAISDSRKIIVSVDGGNVSLSGVVHSWSERELISDSVLHTPGVSNLYNNIAVIF